MTVMETLVDPQHGSYRKDLRFEGGDDIENMPLKLSSTVDII